MNSQIPEIDPWDLKFPLLDFDLVFVHYFHTISTFLYAGMIMCILQSYMLQLCNLLLDLSYPLEPQKRHLLSNSVETVEDNGTFEVGINTFSLWHSYDSLRTREWNVVIWIRNIQHRLQYVNTGFTFASVGRTLGSVARMMEVSHWRKALRV